MSDLMISEPGRRYVAELLWRLDRFEHGRSSLSALTADVETLTGLLLDEADTEWVNDLQAENNRLEFVNAILIHEDRPMNPGEADEVSAAIRQLRRILTQS